MKKQSHIYFSVIGGLVLIAVGVLLLLSNLEIIPENSLILFGVLVICGGLLFLGYFLKNRRRWWVLIPGTILVGIGITMLLNFFNPAWSEKFGEILIFALIGLAFWLIYLNDHKHWWAIIPGGVIWSLAAGAIFSDEETLEGMIFFLGMGLTFLLVYLLPNPLKKMTWALIPAGILTVIGFIVILGAEDLLRFLGPILLLAGGLLLLVVALLKK